MNLRYCCMGAHYAGETRHPQKVMEDLGITYQHATPQSMGDQWWFWNCEGLPDQLPEYLSELKVKPMDAIGYGLNREIAEKLAANNQTPRV